MSSEFKCIKYLEWCTKLPAEERQLESPVFLLKNCECLFRIALEEDYYNLYVEVKSGHSKWEPCDVTTLAGFKKEDKLSLDEKTETVSTYGATEIWYMLKNGLRSKLPTNYMDGDLIKFQFFFKGVHENLLKIENEVVDKCFQTGSYLNGDVSVESFPEDFSKLLDTGENHEAEIKCGDHTIKVHKIILSTRSEVFKAMLQSEMLEGRTGVIEIQDMDVSYIQDFVRYLYTGKMPELTFEKAKILYEAGDKYAVRSLMFRCSEYLQDALSPENALECFALADAHSDEKLKNSFITFALEKQMYLQEETWLPFCENYPKIAFEVYRLSHKK